jgi:hypothetical protein
MDTVANCSEKEDSQYRRAYNPQHGPVGDRYFNFWEIMSADT